MYDNTKNLKLLFTIHTRIIAKVTFEEILVEKVKGRSFRIEKYDQTKGGEYTFYIK